MSAGPEDRSFTFRQVTPEGRVAPVTRELAEEVPIAIEFNGIGYAVLMATPADVEELVLGFALAERLIGREDAPFEVDVHATAQGIVARATLPQERTEALLSRVRHRASESSCGICGVENLEQAIRPLPPVTASILTGSQAVFRALEELKGRQPLNARTGAAHAAALAAADGAIRLAREDVGRHNAFDKLIGAMWRRGWAWDGGFALLSSRCSYELVEKAVLADCPLLATISAPTRLAAERAAGAGLALAVLARADSILLYGEGTSGLDQREA
ncbi:formate dehydrogenase accessory protein FdhD [Sphingobium indicum IP26]|uniref:Sulfur carrier protein FdhD n=1 Tax=Sphingobium indicum F2 TaxID=1450518 RepID=A0A8E1C270_9SPHN|nr:MULTISPECIES: formate dehydrogenase accessory sulfurtransferase FdhD [Sphingobium]EPR14969.1 formate dehydrogenase accessory protein FdhD [Sphingobium indicum IP26]EQB02277.1 formate dehydrogenase accessory protein FdhD [Sphingobium sp. HDIP04]KER35859.1 formate dehydrogenase [Sphingobium indicum F2]